MSRLLFIFNLNLILVRMSFKCDYDINFLNQDELNSFFRCLNESETEIRFRIFQEIIRKLKKKEINFS